MPKSVLIVGASSGIGFALAKDFHSRGYKVYAGSRKVEKMEPLAELGITTLALDITSKESIQKAHAFVEKENNGDLDLLYLNAGITKKGSLFDMNFDNLDQCYQTNVIGPMRVIQTFHRMLLKAKGTVVFTSSLAVHSQVPEMFAYTSTKTSFDLLARQLAMEASKLGIKTVNVRTGPVESDMWERSEGPYVPPKDSVFYLGEGKPLMAQLDPPRMKTSQYAREVIDEVEKAMRSGKVYTCVYKGPTVSMVKLMGMLPYSWYIAAIHKYTKYGESMEKLSQKKYE